MNNKSNIVVILTLLFLFPIILQGISFAETYYVDAINGNDADPGTSEQPWKTLSKAHTTMVSGDTAIVKDGDYGSFDMVIGSDRTDWITYRAADGHTPTISGTVAGISAALQIRPSPWNVARNAYVIFDGFNITNRVHMPGLINYVKLLNCDIQQTPATDFNSVPISGYYEPYFVPWVGAIHCNGIVNCLTIQDCNIHHADRGISTYGTHILIRGNKLHHFSSDGICLAYHIDDVIIEENEIYDIRWPTGDTQIKGTFTGTFIDYETLTMPGTDATGVVWKTVPGATPYLAVWPTSKKTFYEYYNEGYITIVGQTSGATLTNITTVDPPHTDCIERESINYDTTGLIIRNNIMDRRRYVGRGTTAGQGGKIVAHYPKTITLTFENNIVDLGTAIAPCSSQFYFAGLENSIINNNVFIANGMGAPWFMCEYGGGSTISEFYNNICEKMYISAKGYDITFAGHGNNIFKTAPYVGAGQVFEVDDSEKVIVSDPNLEGLFVDFDIDGTDVSDFRLAPGSLAIDFGNPDYGPATDILGNPRVGAPDAGCYEYGSSPLKGDLNKDGKVNIQDVQACVNHISGKQDWGTRADVNGDGKVDEMDVREIMNIILGE